MICQDCGHPKLQLFSSWVCEHCESTSIIYEGWAWVPDRVKLGDYFHSQIYDSTFGIVPQAGRMRKVGSYKKFLFEPYYFGGTEIGKRTATVYSIINQFPQADDDYKNLVYLVQE